MTLPWPLVWNFEGPHLESSEDILSRLLDATDAATKPKKSWRLRCSDCRHEITSIDAKSSALGAHEHRCTNPHGITYHIGCFSEAPGCVEIGDTTEDFSWFPGYRWRIALCANCQTHLGWGFRARSGDRFFGLILDRLIGA